MSTNSPEFLISDEEGEKLEQALNKVLAEYSVVLSAKNAAWANLLLVVIGIYSVRIFAVIQRKRHEARQHETQEMRTPVMTQETNPENSPDDERKRAEKLAKMSHHDELRSI